ncbi:hypothetical protein BH10CYA1_BH10CYA1_09520 [soil metagenome]
MKFESSRLGDCNLWLFQRNACIFFLSGLLMTSKMKKDTDGF